MSTLHCWPLRASECMAVAAKVSDDQSWGVDAPSLLPGSSESNPGQSWEPGQIFGDMCISSKASVKQFFVLSNYIGVCVAFAGESCKTKHNRCSSHVSEGTYELSDFAAVQDALLTSRNHFNSGRSIQESCSPSPVIQTR